MPYKIRLFLERESEPFIASNEALFFLNHKNKAIIKLNLQI